MGESRENPEQEAPDPSGSDPDAVLADLLAGNQRFVAGQPRFGHHIAAAAAHAADQHPVALLIGCIDSRVPLEAVFDQDFGGILVARTGGQVLDQAVLGSVEFALYELRVPVVMVLGHKRCGAIAASVAAVESGERPGGPLGFLVDQIAPAVTETIARIGPDPAVPEVVSVHVRRTVAALSELPSVAEALRRGALRVVGGRYDLDTGRVELLTD